MCRARLVDTSSELIRTQLLPVIEGSINKRDPPLGLQEYPNYASIHTPVPLHYGTTLICRVFTTLQSRRCDAHFDYAPLLATTSTRNQLVTEQAGGAGLMPGYFPDISFSLACPVF